VNWAYQQAGPKEEHLAALKQAAGGEHSGWYLMVGEPAVARMRLVPTQAERVLESDVAVLTEWRNRHVTSFLTEFEATPARTRDWLVQRVGPDRGRVLFMVESMDGRLIGYMGLAFIDWASGSGEADAVVRGVEGFPGVMSTGLRTLLWWAQCDLGLVRLGVRVRSDNPALGFYRKLGFQERQREALRRTEVPGMVTWVADPELASAAVSLVHMDWPMTGRTGPHDSH
jgi:RimJ/RimL family protein N-acetyltransferase